MNKYLDLEEIVLLGRTFDEYIKMFCLEPEALHHESILDVASGVSSFCREANTNGLKVTASDRIYSLEAEIIESKCSRDLEKVLRQIPEIKDLYVWSYFSDIASLEIQRQRAYTRFVEDFRVYGHARYVPTEYPATDFKNNQSSLALVSHFLFLYEDQLDYGFHKATILELARITQREIRIFPILNLRGRRSSYVDMAISDEHLRHLSLDIVEADYEFMKNGNEMLIIAP